MKRMALLMGLMMLIPITSCKNDSRKEETTKEQKQEEPEVITVDTEMKKKMDEAAVQKPLKAEFNNSDVENIFNLYLEIKTFLVRSEPAGAAARAQALQRAVIAYSSDPSALAAVKELADARHIDLQRVALPKVTAAVEKMLEGAIESGQVYKLYCPMAFDNKGAYWLSESNVILNPYFGSEMLKCGRVDSEIK